VTGDDGVDAQHEDHASQPPDKAEGSLSPSNPKDRGNGKDSVNGEQSPAARFWTIVKEVFEVVSLVAVIATMIFVGLQWREMARQYGVMANQLKEMHTTGEDTHALAIATGSYAADMKRLAEQATSQATQTKLLAEAAGKSAAAAEKSEAVTEKLARATADAAAASHSLAESAGQSTAATQRLADAANDANAVSRELVIASERSNDMTVALQRATVVVSGVKIQTVSMQEVSLAFDQLPTEQQKSATGAPQPLWLINLILENSGNTPTKDLTINTNFWWDTTNVAKHPLDVSAIPTDSIHFKSFSETNIYLGPRQSEPVVSGFVGLFELMIYGVLGPPHLYV